MAGGGSLTRPPRDGTLGRPSECRACSQMQAWEREGGGGAGVQ